jgi:uncharacterized protein (TIGR03437 family)
VNLWRAAGIVDSAVRFEGIAPNLNEVRTTLARGTPVLIALGLSTDGRTPQASHFVVATGISESGTILIHDPNPIWNRSTLDGYLEGFTAHGTVIKADLLSALAASTSSEAGGRRTPEIVIASTADSISLASRKGPCGTAVAWPSRTAPAANLAQAPTLVQQFCQATEAEYQLSVAASNPFRAQITRLQPSPDRVDFSGDGDAGFQVRITDERLLVEPASLTFSTNPAVNAADFSSSLAPGSLVSLSGSGFPADIRAIGVDVDGLPARVVATSPFEIRFEIPLDANAGFLRLSAPSGEAEASLDLLPVAPAIFPGSLSLPDGSQIRLTNPARRGSAIVFYATGLGKTDANGIPIENATVLIGDRVVRPFYIGRVTAYPGVYQLNVTCPPDIAPGSNVSLAIQQGNSTSQSLFFAIQ